MKKFKVVVHSLLVEDGGKIEKSILSEIDANVVVVPSDNSDLFFEEIKNADAIIIANTEIEAEHVAGLEQCKIIARQGVGFNNIDLVNTKKKGIVVTNVPDYCTEEVSNFTMSLMLSLLRHIPTYDKHIREGIWYRGSIMTESGFPPMRRLNTLTLGVVGFGRIGREVAKKAKVFGFKVLTSDPYITAEMAEEHGATLVNFETIIKESDVISVHSPLTPESKHLFDLEVFNKMKDTAILVNTARGPLVKEEDIIVALKDKIIAGAALDVVEVEPLSKDSELIELENVILTPHVAHFTQDSHAENRTRSAKEVVRVLSGKEANSRVN